MWLTSPAVEPRFYDASDAIHNPQMQLGYCYKFTKIISLISQEPTKKFTFLFLKSCWYFESGVYIECLDNCMG